LGRAKVLVSLNRYAAYTQVPPAVLWDQFAVEARPFLPNKRSFLNPFATLGELSSLFHFFLEWIDSGFISSGGGVDISISDFSGNSKI
jgi:hypothetical protein